MRQDNQKIRGVDYRYFPIHIMQWNIFRTYIFILIPIYIFSNIHEEICTCDTCSPNMLRTQRQISCVFRILVAAYVTPYRDEFSNIEIKF